MKRAVPILAAVVSLLLVACAGFPAQRPTPAWTLQAPPPDGTNTFFVGYSSGSDQAKVEDDAINRIIADIVRYIGVTITVDSTATAKATLEGYGADVVQTVKSAAAGRVSGLGISDRYLVTDRKTGTITLYLLVAYRSADLEREKARIEAVFREQQAAVSGPEAEAAGLAAAGRLYEAVRKFVDAAVAASGSGLDNADIKVERNLRSARDSLSGLRLSPLGPVPAASLATPFSAPFRLRVTSGTGASAQGLGNIPMLVTYQRRQASRLVSRTEAIASDATGLVSFQAPPPEAAGPAKISFRVDFESTLELLESMRMTGRTAAAASGASQRDALVAELRNSYLEMSYQVASAASATPTAIAVVDLDESGVPIGSSAQAALAEALGRERFVLRTLSLDGSLLAGGDEASILAAARSALAGSAERLVYGRARLLSIRQDGSSWIAEASGTVTAVELSGGRQLYASQRSAMGFGPDQATARKAALRELGLVTLAKDLLANLP